MSMSSLIFIGVLCVAWVLIKIAPRLLVRQVARFAAKKVGEAAMAKVPDQIQLSRVAAPQWNKDKPQTGRYIQARERQAGIKK